MNCIDENAVLKKARINAVPTSFDEKPFLYLEHLTRIADLGLSPLRENNVGIFLYRRRANRMLFAGMGRPMKPYRIVLADDHAMLREGIKGIINATENMAVVGEAGDGLELLRLLKKTDTDMAILDISMPNLRGIEAIHEIKTSYPQVKVLILSMHKKKEYLHRVLSLGADGFLLKDDSGNELINAINTIRKGGTFLSPIFIRDFSQDLMGFCRRETGGNKELLSVRERQVLKLLVDGKYQQ